jgi:potassium-transporting ATPase KdpC subunit
VKYRRKAPPPAAPQPADLRTRRNHRALPGHLADRPIPADLLTSSASGLDPHISPASAFAQVDRVAKARGVSPDTIRKAVELHVEGRQFGIFGEPRVNVLALNLALDK